VILIPVIDLKLGTVVHARAGERRRYRPIRSRLCRGSGPIEVIGALLGVHPFAALYVADLDRIEGEGDNLPALTAIRRAYPDLPLWVDSGLASASDYLAWQQRDLGLAVIGSESLESIADWRRIGARGAAADAPILSLDFRNSEFLGPPALAAQPALWPRRVIVMSLDRVGGGSGPDVIRLASILRRAGKRRVYAAGGVRNLADASRLAEMGIAGALVASALHDGRLGRADIARLAAATS